ncbi:MAG: FecR family protein [Spirochaetaceae bacterium]|jgi:hypothetical protein|nr:FecR family protein [Spirochaetaceae bacterium]
MKKTVIIAVLILLCSGLSFAQNGVIKEISGTVELKRPGAAAFIAAKAGDAVTRDTVVSTGFKSTALIEIGNSVITVRPLTRLSLAELSAAEGTETINVSIQTGRVRVDVTPPAGAKTNMNVRGPSATASVRGTSFDFDTRNLSVQHGTVAFQGSRGRVVLVRAGSSSYVQSDGRAASPQETSVASLLPPPIENNAAASTSTLPAGGGISGKGGEIFGKVTIEFDYSGSN